LIPRPLTNTITNMFKTFLFKVLLEDAIQQEEQAYIFYKKALDSFTNVLSHEIKDLLGRLASAELQHRILLEKFQNIGELARHEFAAESREEEELFDVKGSPGLSITPDMDLHRVLLIARGKEVEAFNYYIKLRDKTNHDELKETLVILADEEAKHLEWIETEIEGL
jgi:rubrerythrin